MHSNNSLIRKIFTKNHNLQINFLSLKKISTKLGVDLNAELKSKPLPQSCAFVRSEVRSGVCSWEVRYAVVCVREKWGTQWCVFMRSEVHSGVCSWEPKYTVACICQKRGMQWHAFIRSEVCRGVHSWEVRYTVVCIQEKRGTQWHAFVRSKVQIFLNCKYVPNDRLYRELSNCS